MASNTSTDPNPSTNSSSFRVLSPIEDPTSHFFLHHGETPIAILVSQSLKSENYPSWARAMKMASDTKNKLGFVDGSITESITTTPIQMQAWSRCNNMISSWILNSVSPFLRV